MHLMTMKNTMDSMMMIELHSYIGAFRPTDKVRPGFRDRYGTLYVLTHSKPYNKKFVIIPTKNIISEHFKCRQDYVYLCESPNQAAHRYNNVPGGKIFFSSHLNSSQMNFFVKNLIPTITPEQLGLSPEATVSADDVVLAFVPVDGYDEAYKSETSAVIRESAKAPVFGKAIQARQIAEFLQTRLKIDEVEIPEDKYNDVVEAINFFLECDEADKSTAEALIIEQIAASDVNAPVSPEAIVAVFEEKIENDTLNVATGLPREEEIVAEADIRTAGDSTEQMPADALQIAPAAQPTVVAPVPAGTLPVKATDLKEIYTDVDALENAARNVAAKVRDVIIRALDGVAAQTQEVEAQTEEAEINL